MNNCPICSGKALRHIKNGRVYWYCHHCYQEVPDFAQLIALGTIDRKNYCVKGTDDWDTGKLVISEW
jgi:ribosomal protein L37AE/L43A